MSQSSTLLLLGSVSLMCCQVATAATPPVKMAITQTANTKTPNITGTWKVSISEAGRGPTYVFTQQGKTLAGIIKGLPIGDMPIAGTISNDGKLTFAGKARGMKFSFVGTITGQTMKGTADLPIGRKNWTATKVDAKTATK